MQIGQALVLAAATGATAAGAAATSATGSDNRMGPSAWSTLHGMLCGIL